MGILEIGVACDVEMWTSHAVDTPREDGIELRRLRILYTLLTLGRSNTCVAINDLQGDVGDEVRVYTDVVETMLHGLQGGNGAGRVASHLISLAARAGIDDEVGVVLAEEAQGFIY
jgi:hypothetical protein